MNSTYSLMLKWKPEPVSIQGGNMQRDNRLAFVQHADQGKGEK